jgi:uncharacterized protein (DUF1778 family)/uncharacterized protein YegP (UPF0339 family)
MPAFKSGTPAARADDQYTFNLSAANGEKILSSERYASHSGATRGIGALKRVVCKPGNLPYSRTMGAPIDTAKSEAPARLEARISRRTQALLKRAATLQGRSLTDFVVTAAEAEAKRVLEDEAILRVSLDDQKRIATALRDPPKANAALRRAFARRRKLIASQ